MDKATNRYAVPALEKSLSIIEILANSTPQPLGITDLIALCNIPKTSVFMILATLEDFGYIEKTIDGKFLLTLKLYDLGISVLKKTDLRYIANIYMEELANQLGYTVHLAILMDGKAVYIDKVSGPSFVQFSTEIGQSWYLHISGVGKAMAAYLTEKDLDDALQKHGLPKITDNTITSIEEFKLFLKSVRDAGFAIEDEEGEKGVRCIAAPIFDNKGKVIAALSVTSIRSDLSSQRYNEVGQILKEKALNISNKIGYRP